MRVPWPGVAAGVVVLALGAAGLVRAAVPQSSAAATTHTTVGQLAVTGAYVREPVPPTQVAAGYFTVRNGTDHPDVLDGVSTGAGLSAQLHVIEKNGDMKVISGGVTIPAHGAFVLTTGKSHLMISQLVAPLHVGDQINIELDFQTAGTIDVVAPVVAVGAPAPDGGSTSMSAMPGMTGAHS